jgi:micrococcal nuclease
VAVGGVAAAVAAAVTGAAPAIGLAAPPPAHAEVATIVDADTVDVRSNDQITRIRLGNIATPAPLAPGFPTACLQPEASAQLNSIIPAGTQLTLSYDTDQFGRTVAQAVTPDGRLVNAELVRAGVAEPVIDGGNPTLPPAIAAAAQDALTNKRGVHAPGIACTVPGQVKTLSDQVAKIPTAAPAGASLTTLVTAANTATQTRMAAETLASDFGENHQDTTWTALDPSEKAQLQSQVNAAVVQVSADETALRAATNATVNQQATDSANQREQARIAKAIAEIRKAEAERAAQAARREAEARKAAADAAAQKHARLEAQRKQSDPSQSASSRDDRSLGGDSTGSDRGSSSSSDKTSSSGDSGSNGSSEKKKSSSGN